MATRAAIAQNEESVEGIKRVRHGSILPASSQIGDYGPPKFSPTVTVGDMRPPLLAQIEGQPSPHLPVWFMRQAGRSLPEYRKIRANIPMLESCLNPEIAAEITCQPVRRHRVDAAVFFSDIMVPLKLAGVGVHIEPGVGPVLDHPITSLKDIEALHELTLEGAEVITEGVRLVTQELGDPKGDGPFTPVIGFAGAPFTLAAYLVEGQPSRDHLAARTMMHADPDAWHALLAWCAQISIQFVQAQVAGGASVIQLFDSWAGSLGEADYRAHVVDHSATVLQAAKAMGMPTIHFGTGTGEFLPAMRDAGADVVGVDHRISLAEANDRLGGRVPLQGNINPAFLMAPWPILEGHLRQVIESGKAAPGHIVNLAHGVPPTTDPEVLTRIVAFVHDYTAQG